MVANHKAFLTAAWRNLILANYAVPEDVLRPYLPPGVELDRWRGKCYASLVAFQFLETKVLGIGWPTFKNFPEWNLRIYVRHGEQRGVVFVREWVPQRFVAWVARTIYNEPYRAAPMAMKVDENPETLSASYTVTTRNRVHTLAATGSKPMVRPSSNSVEHFFKEHSWGFGKTRKGELLRYEVNHPEWDVYTVRDFRADLDWGVLYGDEWKAMNGREPDSIVLAAGSAVSVYPHGKM